MVSSFYDLAMSDSDQASHPVYSRPAITLHWLSALLIISLWPMGKIMTRNKDASWAANTIKAHTIIGLVVGVFTAIRLIVHWTGPKIDKLDMPGWERVLFRINHLLLYVAMITSVATGLLMYREAGASLLFNDGFDLRAVGKGNDWADRHELPANLMLFMFVMHVVGVLFYQMTKGRTLRRMGLPLGNA